MLGHEFARPDLLREALTHRSVAGRRGGFSNERLEFIGDRVLGLLIAEWLAERFPNEQEGDLGKRLAQLVSQPILAAIAEQAGLPALLAVAPGEARAGVRQRATVLADALEATIGALYLDAGLPPARAFIRRVWETTMATQTRPPQDAKTALQEWTQARGAPLPEYEILSRAGPAHAPEFVVRVRVKTKQAQEHHATGTASALRAAEQAAARALLEQIS